MNIDRSEWNINHDSNQENGKQNEQSVTKESVAMHNKAATHAQKTQEGSKKKNGSEILGR